MDQHHIHHKHALAITASIIGLILMVVFSLDKSIDFDDIQKMECNFADSGKGAYKWELTSRDLRSILNHCKKGGFGVSEVQSCKTGSFTYKGKKFPFDYCAVKYKDSTAYVFVFKTNAFLAPFRYKLTGQPAKDFYHATVTNIQKL